MHAMVGKNMLKVKVIAMGRCKEPWLAEALCEYEKRLAPILKLSWVHPKNDTQMSNFLLKEDRYIVLDPSGDCLDSLAFSQKLMNELNIGGSQTVFVIGGPDGFPPGLKKGPLVWSLSRLVFTHQIVRLILVEQIYRAIEIARNAPYHKRQMPVKSKGL
jgi:23S rRNA (pseudouridine1915-N3)-methyltransferase